MIFKVQSSLLIEWNVVLFGCSERFNFHFQLICAVFGKLIVFESECAKGYAPAGKLFGHFEVQVLN